MDCAFYELSYSFVAIFVFQNCFQQLLLTDLEGAFLEYMNVSPSQAHGMIVILAPAICLGILLLVYVKLLGNPCHQSTSQIYTGLLLNSLVQ